MQSVLVEGMVRGSRRLFAGDPDTHVMDAALDCVSLESSLENYGGVVGGQIKPIDKIVLASCLKHESRACVPPRHIFFVSGTLLTTRLNFGTSKYISKIQMIYNSSQQISLTQLSGAVQWERFENLTFFKCVLRSPIFWIMCEDFLTKTTRFAELLCHQSCCSNQRPTNSFSL